MKYTPPIKLIMTLNVVEKVKTRSTINCPPTNAITLMSIALGIIMLMLI